MPASCSDDRAPPQLPVIVSWSNQLWPPVVCWAIARYEKKTAATNKTSLVCHTKKVNRYWAWAIKVHSRFQPGSCRRTNRRAPRRIDTRLELKFIDDITLKLCIGFHLNSSSRNLGV